MILFYDMRIWHTNCMYYNIINILMYYCIIKKKKKKKKDYMTYMLDVSRYMSDYVGL